MKEVALSASRTSRNFYNLLRIFNFQYSIVNPGLSGVGLGHLLQGFVHGIIDFGKPGDAHHAKNFFKVVGDAGNCDELIVLFGLGQNLDEYRNTTAVDVDISLSLQQDIARTLLVDIFVSFVQERLGKARYITLDVQQCYGTVLFELDFISVQHLHPALSQSVCLLKLQLDQSGENYQKPPLPSSAAAEQARR